MGSGFEVKNNELILRINPKVYSIERVYATAYIFLDRFYFIFDGDKDKEIIIRIKPKGQKTDLEAFANQFFEEMVSISNYFSQFERNREIINIVLQRALFSVAPKPLTPEEKEALENLDEGKAEIRV